MHHTPRRSILSVLFVAGLLAACGTEEPAAVPTPAGHADTPAAPTEPGIGQGQVTFVTGSPIEVEHDYDQHVSIGVRNGGPGMAHLRVRATAPEDLPTGFVGRGTGSGTQSMALGIPAGETWQVPLLVHADHAASSTYEVTLEALPLEGARPLATAALEVRVEAVEMKLETGWRRPADPLARARLIQVLRIRNVGPPVSDLTVAFAPGEGGNARSVQIHPIVERTRLLRGGEIQVEVSPRLHPAFEEIAGEIVLTGIGQELRLPYRQDVPQGHQVFVTLSRSTCRCENTGTRCANCEKVDYTTDATKGTPVHPGDSSFRHTEEESDGEYGWTGGVPDDLPDMERPEWEDDGIHDHADANTEGTEDGELPPESTGSERPRRPEVNRPLGEELPESPSPDTRGAARPTTRETTSYRDRAGRPTHMVRKRRRDGDDLNFSFGMQPGKRLKVPVSMGHRVHQPSLGPSPNAAEGGGVVAYAKDTEEGGRVIEVLDPRTGKKVSIGDPTGRAESPKLVRVGDHVELFYRVDGALKRARLADDMESIEPVNWPPPETSVGRLLEAATTPDGQPFVVSVRGDEVAVTGPDGREAFGGDHADVAYTKDGRRWLAVRQTDGSIVAIGPDGAVTPLVDASPSNGPPALLRTKAGGARLFFHRAMPSPDEVPEGAVGLALGGNFAIELVDGAWGTPRRMFLPEMPVDVAAVVLSMRLPYGHAHYSPMNMRVELNGHPIGRIENKIPQGRYVFRVPPHFLRYASAAGAEPGIGNTVTLRISGIGRGHFHVTDSCGIYTQSRLLQDCLVARTAEEAEAFAQASVTGTRHEAPDLIVTSNGWELPRNAQPGELVEMRVGVFNAGDRPVPEGTLHWSIGGEVRGEAAYPRLAPFRGRTLTVPARLPDTWQAGTGLELTVRAPVEGDVAPESNTLGFVIMKELAEKVAGPTGPAAVDFEALPEDAVTPVDLSSGEPFETALDRSRIWYRVDAVHDRTLDVVVDGPDAARVRDIQLFTEEGVMRIEDGVYETGAARIYVRVEFAGVEAIPAGTVLRISWQS